MDPNLEHRTTLAFLYFRLCVTFVVCYIVRPLLVVVVVFSSGSPVVMCDAFMISTVPILNCRVKVKLWPPALHIGSEHLLVCTVLHTAW